MSEGFVAAPDGVVATFSGFEADLLRNLASQLVELLRDDAASPSTGEESLEELLDFSGPTHAPEDPVLARLLPTAYPDDDEAAGEFRRYTESGLREGKVGNAVAIIEALESAGLPSELHEEGLWFDIELDQAAAWQWLRGFTDIRLALATRLGLEQGEEDYWASLPDDDPRSHVYDIYEWVGYLQETLVRSVA